MATSLASAFLKRDLLNFKFSQLNERLIHVSPALLRVVSGKIKPSLKRNKPVKYEAAFSPPHIGRRKAWNSWNTTTIQGGLRRAETAVDDMFIRKFIFGTFTGMLESEVIIKRQHNIIRIAAILCPKISESILLHDFDHQTNMADITRRIYSGTDTPISSSSLVTYRLTELLLHTFLKGLELSLKKYNWS